MLILTALLALPAMTALAMPGVTVTKLKEVIKRGELPPTITTVPLVPNFPSELIKPRINAPENTVTPSSKEQSYLQTASGPPPTITTVPLVPTSPSELILPHEENLGSVSDINESLHKRVKEPSLPEFIDNGACLCGLLRSQATLFDNGKIHEMWRCTADAAHSIIDQGGNGKWYNTTLPSEEVSGVGKARNWGDNPPYVGQTYVLTFQNGGASYALLNSGNAGALHGNDYQCTGVNDTSASVTFYAGQ